MEHDPELARFDTRPQRGFARSERMTHLASVKLDDGRALGSDVRASTH